MLGHQPTVQLTLVATRLINRIYSTDVQHTTFTMDDNSLCVQSVQQVFQSMAQGNSSTKATLKIHAMIITLHPINSSSLTNSYVLTRDKEKGGSRAHPTSAQPFVFSSQIHRRTSDRDPQR